jgi:cysteinyl-tRNA synthetase
MNIFLHNTLTGKKEVFTPISKPFFGRPKVGMYHCGPTVYNYPHIGNLRAYVFADTLKRLMKASGYKVEQVINITDVGHLVSDADTGEDKMEKARAREGKSAQDIANFYTQIFFENLKDLNIDTEKTHFPKATEYIPEQIAIVKTLEKKGFTYKTSDGIYFDTSRFPHYGKLGNIDIQGIREGERIGTHAEKKNPTDFALWKFSPSDHKREQEWPSPWGVGFPGWHIECSAMSKALLGTTFDIHTGGIDHIPVHHNNEIAQSESAHDKEFVHYWLHSAFVTIEGSKMAKSEGNFLTLQSIKEKNISPLAYRYFLLSARYSTPLNFTWEALEAAQTAYKRMNSNVAELPNGGRARTDLVQKALSFISDDLDTPKALALVWDILKDDTLSPADKKATIVKIDALLGLLTKEQEKASVIPPAVQALALERQNARVQKDWKKSDELRDKIKAEGFEIKDTPHGYTLTQL